MSDAMPALRERRLRALDVQPLQLRRVSPVGVAAPSQLAIADEVEVYPQPAGPAAVPEKTSIRRLALQPDPAELSDPAINRMYQALTEAVPKAGLQSVRVCDVAGDSTAAVMVFGAAPLPEGVPLLRILRADPLRVLLADRDRKRLLWERMQSLGRGAGA